MNCAKCGKENQGGDKFCGGCGAALAAPPPAAPAPPAAPGSPLPMSAIIIAVVAALAIGGGVAAYVKLGKKDDGAKITLNIGEEKIVIGAEEVGRAMREAERVVEREGSAVEQKLPSNVIRGKIVDIGWKKYVVKSFATGKTYVINLGRVTTYNVRRKAVVGDVVTATVDNQRGKLVGTRIEFE